jgi:hypothetical protein
MGEYLQKRSMTLAMFGRCEQSSYNLLQSGDTPQALYPHVDWSRPKRSDAYWSSTKNADAMTLRTLKVDDILLSILTIATPGDRGLSHL